MGDFAVKKINKLVLAIFQFKRGVLMKKILSKIKKTYKNFVSGKSGFSLVELIVVIAIMAVMAAVLAPALLGYVEKSRAQKDYSAMGEVSNSVQLALADTDVYDEMLQYAVDGNWSCYADGDTSTNTDGNKVYTKTGSTKYWIYNDECRLLDETIYHPAGFMRGVTITFFARDNSINLTKGVINNIDGTSKGKSGYLENAPELYNRVRSIIGDKLDVSSQTYRNSEYTLFINLGTTGGNESSKQDAIQVYGQYNGTNLEKNASSNYNLNGKEESSLPDESNLNAPPLPTSTGWSELINASRDGTYVTKYPVGSRITLQLKTGNPAGVQTADFIVIAHDIDKLQSGETAHMTLVSDKVLTTHAMNRSITTSGGWENSYMRTWLLSNPFIPEDAYSCISTVVKTTYNNDTDSAQITNDKLWLLSEKEVTGSQRTELFQYDCFSERSSRVKFNLSGAKKSWWLRTPQGDRGFRGIGSDSWGLYQGAASALGVVIGFCV